ncbi:uncharacterized protein BP5553_02413 [Venustampulla echinocandica]|uniref:Uncharacterized protein n=1 Tax=Venustampulla echinocandica TaxID=2656787 RepID=A0A370U3U0_9HELO|nr:uncharacterized protein BP5553_02413 [Venustampulla echinocandica]RDL42434.1 hypothetical protein BP5553_02413 [Venustampulla echinocandica]
MRLSTSLLVPALISAASAASDASVYIFQGDESPNASNRPALSPEQARLVFAQRLGTSQYHGLKGASEDTLSYINKFGGRHSSLFQDLEQSQAAELVLIVEGVCSEATKLLLNTWAPLEPAFTISEPPSLKSNKKFIADLNQQSGQSRDCLLEDAINPYQEACWNGKSKVIHFDLGATKDQSKLEDLISAQKGLIRWAKNQEMNTVVVLMPEASRLSETSSKPYGSYENAPQISLGRRQGSEEVMSESPKSSAPPSPPVDSQLVKTSNSTAGPVTGVIPSCHSSLDACISATKNCSGHGECFKKYGTISDGGVAKGACFSCGCVPQNETFWFGGSKDTKANKKGHRTVYYGGGACQKKDISGPFWLIAVFTIVMVGLVSSAIGMLFSIGEEKLPGVIGAGVSSKAR